MYRLVATLAAIATLLVQLSVLSDMATREKPPLFLVKAKEYFSAPVEFISTNLSEQNISNRQVSSPEGIFGKAVYAFHRSTQQAWKYWLFVSLSISAVVFVVVFVLDVGIDIDLIDFEDLAGILGASIGALFSVMAIKFFWILIRIGWHSLFG